MRSFKALLATMVVASLVVAIGLSATAVHSLQALNAQAEKVYASKDVTADILPPPMYLIEMRLVASEALEGTMPLDQADRELTRLEGEYQARVSYWSEHPPYGLERDLLGAQHASAQRFMTALRRDFWPKIAAGDHAGARAALGDIHALYLEHRSGVDTTVKSSTNFANDMMAGFAATRETTSRLALSGLAVGSALLLGMFFWVRRRLFTVVGAEPEALAVAASHMASGDLSQAIDAHHPNSVAGSLEALRRNLGQLIDATHTSAATVSTAAREIAQGTQDLSNRTEQQAGSLEQTAASMEELNGATKHNADTARQATQLAAGATEVAERGGVAVSRVVGTMQEIQATSRRISEIIVVIDDIAFQTNLLALNAAVEAARAGEHGRGFAVVAGEVGALANRSAQAAREIKSLINTSVQNVDSGSAEVKAAGDTMSEIVEHVKNVSALISEIAQSALEQNEGIGSVSRAVMELDQMTQQNAAMVEQSTAAAISLRDEAARLVSGVGKFQRSESSAGASAPAEPAARAGVAARAPLSRAA